MLRTRSSPWSATRWRSCIYARAEAPQWAPIPGLSSRILNHAGLAIVRWRLLLALASAIAGLAGEASSQPRPATAEACRLQTAGSGKVSGILDGRSFALDDGRLVRLSGIE